MTKKMKRKGIRILVSAGCFALLFVLLKIEPWQGILPEKLTFLFPLGLSLTLYLFVGWDVLRKAIRNIGHGRIFDENFLMTLATIGAFVVSEYAEAVAVMLFYEVGEWFQDYAVSKSRRSISSLLLMAPKEVTVERNQETVTVDPEDVAVGEICLVRAGGEIPIDGVVLSGESALDLSSLTGEALWKNVRPGDSVLSGSLVKEGALRIQTTKKYEDSTVAKILELTENATSKKAPTEQFITKFAKYYTPIVIFSAVLLGLIPPIFFHGEWTTWLIRACTFLVISCPCALVISIPLSFFGGIGAASREGILVKGSTYLETLTKARVMAFDKTGTITEGVFRVQRIEKKTEGIKEAEILHTAALLEAFSNHPIARAIFTADAENRETAPQITDVSERSGYGIQGNIDGLKTFVGNRKWMEMNGFSIAESAGAAAVKEETDGETDDETNGKTDGETVIFVATNRVLGAIHIGDKVKETAKETLKTLRKKGISRFVLLTGDTKKTGEKIAKEIGISEVRSELLPGDKVRCLQEIKEETPDSVVAFVGDGMNDAPSLATADVGIAMGALGSDAAIESADIVLMDDRLPQLVTAISIAKKTLRIVYENIVFALFVKAAVLLLGAFGAAGMWLAMFADVGVAVLAILNSMRALRR